MKPRTLFNRTKRVFLYIDPDRVRRQVEHTAVVREPQDGVPLLLDLVGRFVTVSRKYELQGTARSMGGEDVMHPVTRLVPIMGAHFGSFGGFLARPFRDYDYAVGVYDGLYRAATLACAEASDLGEACAGSRVEGCEDRREMLECVTREVLALEDVAGLRARGERARTVSWVVRALLDYELEVALRGREAADAFRARVGDFLACAPEPDAVTRALLEQNLRIDRKLRDPQTAPRDPTVGEFYDIVRAVGAIALEDNRVKATLTASERELFEDPEAWVWTAGKRLSLRALEVEEANGSAVGKGVVGFAAATAHHLAPKQHGLEINASAIPEGLTGGRFAARLLPYEISTHFGSTGIEIGYRAGYRVGSAGSFGLSVKPLSKRGDEYALRAGVWAAYTTQSWIISALEIGGAARYRYDVPAEGEPRLSGGPEVAVMGLFGHLRLSLSLEDLTREDKGWSYQLAPIFRVGIADLPSLVYWGGRMF